MTKYIVRGTGKSGMIVDKTTQNFSKYHPDILALPQLRVDQCSTLAMIGLHYVKMLEMLTIDE